jgi:hypothetical protein
MGCDIGLRDDSTLFTDVGVQVRGKLLIWVEFYFL